MGPQTEGADAIHAMKYRQKGETFRDAVNRVALALSDGDKHYHELRDVLGDLRFMPAGRVQASVGSSREVTPYNCYVSGRIEDSFVSGDGSIMQRAHEAATTMRMGGGIGYDFSTLRPRGALIKKLHSHSSGPISFMRIFNEVCLCTSSAGHRRGAQMGVMRVDHPDIVEFINAKHDNHTLTGFNISVAVTDEFMEAVARGSSFALRFNGETYNEVDARELWEMIMRSTYDWAEPGVLFIDTINKMNNLWYCETIAATNPCGEQPLPPFGACLLGSFNLVKYLTPQTSLIPQRRFGFDWDRLAADIPLVVRAMDNVIDKARYPLPQQEAEAKNKRRMGLGVMALANAGEALGFPYGSPAFLEFEAKVLRFIANKSYQASALLAKEKGAFPLYDAERYLNGKFIGQLDEDTQALIDDFGIRNSHLTSLAPTGTISWSCDYVSSGVEPVFTLGVSQRPVNTPEGPKLFDVQDYGELFLNVKGRQSHEVTPKEHVSVLTTASQWVDSAVSKTCNLDGTVDWDDFKAIYSTAWEGGAKGCTTFNKDGKRFALLTASSEEPKNTAGDDASGETCRIDPETGRRECA